VLLCLLSVASPCEYDDCHSDGGVSLPSGWDFSAPFEEGERVYVLAGYGPSAGSSLHCRAQDSSCANDWYALDLTLVDHANSGRGQPVLAVADGTVLDAGWGSEGWANYGRRVYLSHAPGDGHTYTTMYAHLDSIDVAEGETLSRGDVIGTLGRSCMGEDECSSFSTPHLHFAVHRDAGFGGSGSGGSYGGRAVKPEPIDGAEGLSQGDTFTSDNGEVEDPDPDPDPCPVSAGSVLQEDGDCATRTGSEFRDIDGHGGHAWWTEVDVPSPDYGEGVIYTFQATETLDLYFYAPALTAPASEVILKISHAGGADKQSIDPSGGGWIALGEFDFAGDSWVRVGDTYLDEEQVGLQVGFDALRFEAPGSAPDSSPPEDSDPAADDGNPREPKDLSGVNDEGCGCGSLGSASGLLILCGLLWLRRRSGSSRLNDAEAVFQVN